MNGKDSFDVIAEQYDNIRPNYSNIVINKIIEYAKLSKKSNTLEIGSGSGQLTNSFINLSSSITCIEPGKSFCQILSRKYNDKNNIKIHNCYFEDYIESENSYDLIVSGTAFHWINPNLGFPKIKDLLKPYGSFAFLWHKYNISNKSELENGIDKIYDKYSKYFKNIEKIRNIQSDESICDDWIYKSDLFTQQEKFEDSFDLYLTSEEYIKLQFTHSSHQLLENNILKIFLDELKDIIDSFGGKIKKTIKTEMILGKVNK